MIRNSTKILSIISIVLCIVCGTIVVWFFHTVSEQKKHYNDAVIQNMESKSHEESLRQIIHSLEQTSDNRETLHASILTEEKVIDFLTLLEQLGTEQHVTLTTKSLTTKPINDTFETLIVSIDVTGSYTALMHTLMLLEKIPYSSTITTTQIENTANEGASWHGVFEIRVLKFVKK